MLFFQILDFVILTVVGIIIWINMVWPFILRFSKRDKKAAEGLSSKSGMDYKIEANEFPYKK